MTILIAKASITPAAMFDESNGSLLIRVSSAVPDRDDEVVIPSTIDLAPFKPNPVILAFHDQHRVPIAKAENADGKFECWVQDEDMFERWWFDQSPDGLFFQGLYRRKVMRGASIGFRSFGVDPMRPEESEVKYGIRKQLNIHRGGELLETSAVPVPSCPAALSIEWVDSDALASVVSRGMVGTLPGSELVLKHLSQFASKLTTYRTSIPSEKKNASMLSDTPLQSHEVDETLKGPDMSQAVTPVVPAPVLPAVPVVDKAAASPTAHSLTIEIKNAAEPAKAPATSAVVAKEGDKPADDNTDTTNENDDAADDIPSHDQVKAGLEAGMHECMAAFHKGEMDWDACKSALDEYAADHMKYSGKTDDPDEPTDPNADSGDEKAFRVEVLKQLKAIAGKQAETDAALEAISQLV